MSPEYFNNAPMPFAKLLGITVKKSDPEWVEGEMTVNNELCTSGQILHGGAIMAFADTLGAIATVINLPDEAKGTATIESKTNFFRAAQIGEKLIGRTTPLHRGKTTQVWQTTIESEAGKSIAIVTQTQIVLK